MTEMPSLLSLVDKLAMVLEKANGIKSIKSKMYIDAQTKPMDSGL